MALVAAAVVPHSPLLIPSIAKEHHSRSAGIRTALAELGGDLYAAQPDTVIFLTPHGQSMDETVIVELDDTLRGELSEFGDLTTTVTVPGAVAEAHHLKEAAEDVGLPMLLQTGHGLDYGITVPWLMMWPEPMPWTTLVISVPSLPFESATRYGQLLRDFCQTRPTRFALIASGDTSRRSPTMTDAERRPTGIERLWSEAIVHNDLSRLSGPHVESPAPCLTTPLTVILACLQGLPAKGRIRVFDVPLTVGQVVADWDVSS